MVGAQKSKIDQTANPNLALLVIDAQQGLFEKPTPIYQAADLERWNCLAAPPRAAGNPVVYIQHGNDSFLRHDTPGSNLHPALVHTPSDLYLRKTHASAFEQTGLKEMLDKRQVGRLLICGLVTHGCVKATCQAALELGYRVILVQDGHSSFSKDAPTLIEKWNSELAKAGVELLTTEALIMSAEADSYLSALFLHNGRVARQPGHIDFIFFIVRSF